MHIFPAIDLYDRKAVRLYKGDYDKMTIYSDEPLAVARDFEKKGAKFVHLVDLEGAKLGTTPNIEIVSAIAQNTSLFTEIGGGIRNIETVKKYLPKLLSEDEIKAIILSLEDRSLPVVMKHFKSEYAGKVDMRLVGNVLKTL